MNINTHIGLVSTECAVLGFASEAVVIVGGGGVAPGGLVIARGLATIL